MLSSTQTETNNQEVWERIQYSLAASRQQIVAKAQKVTCDFEHLQEQQKEKIQTLFRLNFVLKAQIEAEISQQISLKELHTREVDALTHHVHILEKTNAEERKKQEVLVYFPEAFKQMHTSYNSWMWYFQRAQDQMAHEPIWADTDRARANFLQTCRKKGQERPLFLKNENSDTSERIDTSLHVCSLSFISPGNLEEEPFLSSLKTFNEKTQINPSLVEKNFASYQALAEEQLSPLDEENQRLKKALDKLKEKTLDIQAAAENCLKSLTDRKNELQHTLSDLKITSLRLETFEKAFYLFFLVFERTQIYVPSSMGDCMKNSVLHDLVTLSEKALLPLESLAITKDICDTCITTMETKKIEYEKRMNEAELPINQVQVAFGCQIL